MTFVNYTEMGFVISLWFSLGKLITSIKYPYWEKGKNKFDLYSLTDFYCQEIK